MNNTTVSNCPHFILNYNDSVTALLARLFNEPIEVSILNQQYQKILPNKQLDNKHDEPILCRTALLFGAHSKTKYLYAQSLIRKQQLNSNMLDALLHKKAAIGSILNQYGLNATRELLDIQSVDSATLRLLLNTEDRITARVYRLDIDQIAAMLITEYYPNEHYQGVADNATIND